MTVRPSVCPRHIHTQAVCSKLSNLAWINLVNLMQMQIFRIYSVRCDDVSACAVFTEAAPGAGRVVCGVLTSARVFC